MSFERELRYMVIKFKDGQKYLSEEQRRQLRSISDSLRIGREKDGKPPLLALCIESDWPEYEPAWKAIEDRMTASNRSDAT